MDRDELVKFWIGSSEKDLKTMTHLFRSKDYHWSLFMGHLVIEKLLKALYVKRISSNPPRIHNLLAIAEKIGIQISEKEKDELDIITTFNIRTRYPDFKEKFFKKCTRNFTEMHIKIIKRIKQWLEKELKK